MFEIIKDGLELCRLGSTSRSMTRRLGNLNLINSSRTHQMEKEMLFWKGDSNNCYLIRANVILLEGESNITAHPWKLLWNNLVPPKVSFFASEVWCGKIITTEHLKKGVSSWLVGAPCVTKLKKT